MAENNRVNLGPWCCFSNYEIKDGCIQPTKKAKLKTYDPWNVYEKARLKKKGLCTPYESLNELIGSLSFQITKEKLYELSPTSESNLLNWCSQYGLLGILPHRSLMAKFTPRWDTMHPDDSGDELYNVQLNFIRISAGWKYVRTARIMPLRQTPKKRGQLAPTLHKSNQPFEEVVLWQEWEDGQYSFAPLEKTWRPFFPRGPSEKGESWDYPMPLSEKFWKMYAEPVEEFLQGARILKSALAELSCLPKKKSKLTNEEIHRSLFGRKLLHSLVDGMCPVLDIINDKFQQRWMAPSLLGSLAMMALQDLGEQRGFLVCRVCNKLFVSKAYQATYCSIRCRNTFNKREYRKNLRK